MCLPTVPCTSRNVISTCLTISDVNWVKDMKIEQEYTKLDNGEWVLTKDDMIAEMHINKLLQDLLVVRNTRITDYAFDASAEDALQGQGEGKARYGCDEPR